MRALLGSCLLTFSLSISAEDGTDASYELLNACLGLVAVSEAIFSDVFSEAELADIKQNISPIALELSKEFTPAYNGITAGLVSALEYQSIQTETNPRIIQDRAAVLGLWCVNDTVQVMNKTSNPMLQPAETQQQLVNAFKAQISNNVQQ